MIALLFIVILAVQPEKPQTVALVIDGQIQFTETESAERLYKALESKRAARTTTEDDERMHAALTATLGTLRQDATTCPDTHQPRCETLRGRRVVLQGNKP